MTPAASILLVAQNFLRSAPQRAQTGTPARARRDQGGQNHCQQYGRGFDRHIQVQDVAGQQSRIRDRQQAACGTRHPTKNQKLD